jgi:phospholipase/lecithinase/hemolysin
MRTAWCVGLLLLSACGGSDSNEANNRYTQMVVLGASLSDTGNASTLTAGILPGNAYYQGRWSNGPLWIDSLANELGLPIRPSLRGGTNYAFGGAKTCGMPDGTTSPTDLCGQLVSYLTAVGNKADPAALYVIDSASVGNNIASALGNNLPSSVITTDAIQDIALILETLYKAGARNFLLTRVPDVGDTPRFRSKGPDSMAAASHLSQSFNGILNAGLVAFSAAHSQAIVKQVDLYGVTKNTAGFGNITDACYDSDANALCTTPDAYLYWDNFHPTAALGGRWYAAASAALKN